MTVEPPAPAGLRSRTFALACLATFTTWLAGYSFIGTVALYAVSLGVPEPQVGWSLAATSLCGVATQLVGGRLQARCARTLLLRLGPLIAMAAALLGLAMRTPAALLATCVFFGVGYGLVQSSAIVIAAEAAPSSRRGQAIGLYGSFTTLGAMLGPVTGIALLQRFGAASVFTSMIVLLVASLVCGLLLAEPPRESVEAAEAGGRLHPPGVFRGPGAVRDDRDLGHCQRVRAPVRARSRARQPGGVLRAARHRRAVPAHGRRGALGPIRPHAGAGAGPLLVACGIWGLALRPTVPWLLFLALLYGVGYAASHPTTIALGYDMATPATRATAMAVVGAGFGAGVTVGAVTMGYVLAHSTYETMFLVAGCIPLVTTGLCLWRWRSVARDATQAAPPAER